MQIEVFDRYRHFSVTLIGVIFKILRKIGSRHFKAGAKVAESGGKSIGRSGGEVAVTGLKPAQMARKFIFEHFKSDGKKWRWKWR